MLRLVFFVAFCLVLPFVFVLRHFIDLQDVILGGVPSQHATLNLSRSLCCWWYFPSVPTKGENERLTYCTYCTLHCFCPLDRYPSFYYITGSLLHYTLSTICSICKLNPSYRYCSVGLHQGHSLKGLSGFGHPSYLIDP